MLVSVEASAACTIQLVQTAKGGVGNGSVAVVGGWRVSCLNREAVMEHCRHSG